MRSQLTYILTIALMNCAHSEEPIIKTDFGFDSKNIPAPDPGKDKPLARIFDSYLYPAITDDREGNAAMFRLTPFVESRLFPPLQAHEKIQATDAEVSRLLSSALKIDLATNKELSDEEKAIARKIAETAVVDWKINALLFQRYGGAVMIDLSEKLFPIPVVANQRLIDEMQRTKVLEIFDDTLRVLFQKEKMDVAARLTPPENVDFRTPWWEKLAESQKEQDVKKQKLTHFDSQKIPAPDPRRGKPVARVLDQYVYPDDLNGKSPAKDATATDQLTGSIFGLLTTRQIEQEKITATEDEIKRLGEYLKSSDPTKTKNSEPNPRYRRLISILMHLPAPMLSTLALEKLPEGLQKDLSFDLSGELNDGLIMRKFSADLYSGMIMQWKLDRVLYKRYGGTVIFQQSNPTEPVGAYRKFLEQLEREKAFEIFDKDDRTAFFAYFVRADNPMQTDTKNIHFDMPWWEKKDEK